MKRAFQDSYLERHSHCFGCGRSNPKGLHLKSHWDGEDTIARFTPPPEFSGGFPGNVYGGLIASLMDCHGTASAAAAAHRHAHDEGDDAAPYPRFVTASLKVDFKQPTPLGVELSVHGQDPLRRGQEGARGSGAPGGRADVRDRRDAGGPAARG